MGNIAVTVSCAVCKTDVERLSGFDSLISHREDMVIRVITQPEKLFLMDIIFCEKYLRVAKWNGACLGCKKS